MFTACTPRSVATLSGQASNDTYDGSSVTGALRGECGHGVGTSLSGQAFNDMYDGSSFTGGEGGDVETIPQ